MTICKACQILNSLIRKYALKFCNVIVLAFMDLRDLSNNCIDTLCKSWRQSIRKSLGITLYIYRYYVILYL